MNYTIKISLGDDIRRFSFTEKPTFNGLKEVLQKLYNDVSLPDHVIKYQDEEQDLITVSCEMEFDEALTINHSKVLRMILVQKSHCQKNKFYSVANKDAAAVYKKREAPTSDAFSPEETTIHKFVICDGCNKSPIVGIRWKCSECRNYDLCTECLKKEVHKETGHQFIEITYPRHRFGRRCEKGDRDSFGFGKGCFRRSFGNFSNLGFGNECRRRERSEHGCKRREFGMGRRHSHFGSKENVTSEFPTTTRHSQHMFGQRPHMGPRRFLRFLRFGKRFGFGPHMMNWKRTTFCNRKKELEVVAPVNTTQPTAEKPSEGVSKVSDTKEQK